MGNECIDYPYDYCSSRHNSYFGINQRHIHVHPQRLLIISFLMCADFSISLSCVLRRTSEGECSFDWYHLRLIALLEEHCREASIFYHLLRVNFFSRTIWKSGSWNFIQPSLEQITFYGFYIGSFGIRFDVVHFLLLSERKHETLVLCLGLFAAKSIKKFE